MRPCVHCAATGNAWYCPATACPPGSRPNRTIPDAGAEHSADVATDEADGTATESGPDAEDAATDAASDAGNDVVLGANGNGTAAP